MLNAMFQGFAAFMVMRHGHHLTWQPNVGRGWYCDNCKKSNHPGVPGFHCSQGCDFDLCDNCMMTQNPTKGKFLYNHPHPVAQMPLGASWRCDVCQGMGHGQPYHCMLGCNYDACETCVFRYATNSPPPMQVQVQPMMQPMMQPMVQPMVQPMMQPYMQVMPQYPPQPAVMYTQPPQMYTPPPPVAPIQFQPQQPQVIVVQQQQQPPYHQQHHPPHHPHHPIQLQTGGTYFYIESTGGLVVDVSGNSTSPGTELIVFPKKFPAADNQLWMMDGNGCIRSKLGHNLVMDVEGGKANPGQRVIMWGHHGNSNQQWKIAGGTIFSMCQGGAHIALDIEGGQPQSMRRVVINPFRPGMVSQCWRISYV